MILTVAQARDAGISSLSDDHLRRLMESAESAIIEAIGPLNANADHPVVEHHRASGPLVMLGRRASSVTSVLEGATTLDPDDYQLRDTGTVLDRLNTGAHPSLRWSRDTVVTYVPFGTFADRARVQLELVRLDIAFTPGISSQSIGPWSESYGSGKTYVEQRSDILGSLGNQFVGIL